jgi:hypothetical protein
VPLGARELSAVGVCVLVRVLAVPQEAGEGSGPGTHKRGPVTQIEVPRYLWAVVNAVYMALLGPAGFAELGHTIASNSAYAARQLAGVPGVSVRWSGFFKELVVDFSATGRSVAEINAGLRDRGIFGGHDLSADYPNWGRPRSTASPRSTTAPISPR